ncbi:MAG: ATP-binding protein [Bryobacterales bacterium]|nr:ATP-binding protein [Bryobacterales bacterium]
MSGSSEQTNCALHLELASNLDSVDQAEEKALEIAAQCGVGEDELHRVGMSVREAMVNAVVHGNKYNRHKKVLFRVETSPHSMIVIICDEGNGFDPDQVPDPNEGENVLRQSGRGIMLIRAFMDDYVVRRRSGGGTEVKLVKKIGQSG